MTKNYFSIVDLSVIDELFESTTRNIIRNLLIVFFFTHFSRVFLKVALCYYRAVERNVYFISRFALVRAFEGPQKTAAFRI